MRRCRCNRRRGLPARRVVDLARSLEGQPAIRNVADERELFQLDALQLDALQLDALQLDALQLDAECNRYRARSGAGSGWLRCGPLGDSGKPRGAASTCSPTAVRSKGASRNANPTASYLHKDSSVNRADVGLGTSSCACYEVIPDAGFSEPAACRSAEEVPRSLSRHGLLPRAGVPGTTSTYLALVCADHGSTSASTSELDPATTSKCTSPRRNRQPRHPRSSRTHLPTASRSYGPTYSNAT